MMKRQTLLITAMAAALTAGGAVATTMQRPPSLSRAQQNALDQAIAAPTRSPANVQRDRYRHPRETLAFFGVRPTDTVVEIWPGGGWYSEILAPYVLSGGGTYYAAAMGERGNAAVQRMMTQNPQQLGRVRLASFPVFDGATGGVPDGTADVVLTFRNVHNWRMGYQRNNQDYSLEAFRQMYRMLKPGGVLGIEDHRLPESADIARERTSGYLKVSTVRHLAEQAGFRFAGASEVNANSRDTANWPNGVWTLPPTLQLGAQDRDRYLAIGESDRMTLRFVKPR
jgi:predicted methyltransferase